jgi:hypothetical protein
MHRKLQGLVQSVGRETAMVRFARQGLRQSLVPLALALATVAAGCDSRRAAVSQDAALSPDTLPCDTSVWPPPRDSRSPTDASGPRDSTRRPTPGLWPFYGGSVEGDSAMGVAGDEKGNLYIAVSYEAKATFGDLTVTPPKGQWPVFVAKLDTQRRVLWHRVLTAKHHVYVHAMAVDAQGAVWVTGFFGGGIGDFAGTPVVSGTSNNCGFVTRIDSAGLLSWVQVVSTSGGGQLLDVAVDSQGACVAGTYSGGGLFSGATLPAYGREDAVVACFDRQGKQRWVASGGGDAHDEAHGVATDSKGRVWVTGHFGQTAHYDGKSITAVGSTNAFMLRYNTSGAVELARATGAGDHYSGGKRLEVDAQGVVHIGGSFTKTATFGTTKLVSKGSTDLFLARADESGAIVWAKALGHTQQESFHDLVLDGQGGYVIGAMFSGITHLGGQTYTTGPADPLAMLALRVRADGSVAWVVAPGSGWTDAVAVAGGFAYIAGGFQGSAVYNGLRLDPVGYYDAVVWRRPL